MINKELNTKYGVLKRVNRKKAERLYKTGNQLYLIPCNVNPDSMWIDFSIIRKSIEFNHSFNEFVNNYEYFNCNNELGNYTVFYVKEGVI